MDENNTSSSSFNSNSSSETETETEINDKTENGSKLPIQNKKQKRFGIICIIIIIFNFSLSFMNIIIFLIFIKYFSSNSSKPSSNNTTNQYKYHMVYYNKNDETMMNKIVNFEVEFEGDFYHFEDENGNGMIIKMDAEGDEYVMCGNECKCYIECMNNEDCDEGMVCDENICMDTVMRRKDTLKSERKVASLFVHVIPISVCIFGLFSTVFFAKEYSNNYFSEKCEQMCPTNSKNVEVDTKVDVKEDQMKAFCCTGKCRASPDKWDNLWVTLNTLANDVGVGITIDQLPENVQTFHLQCSWVPDGGDQWEKFLDNNVVLLKEKCGNTVVDKEIIATDIESAINEFKVLLNVQCDNVKYKFSYKKEKFDYSHCADDCYCEADDLSIICSKQN